VNQAGQRTNINQGTNQGANTGPNRGSTQEGASFSGSGAPGTQQPQQQQTGYGRSNSS
jgi:hypothetical protein